MYLCIRKASKVSALAVPDYSRSRYIHSDILSALHVMIKASYFERHMDSSMFDCQTAGTRHDFALTMIHHVHVGETAENRFTGPSLMYFWMKENQDP